MKLFLIPANEENVEETITKKVSISTIEEKELLDPYQIKELKEMLGDKKEFNCWALTENSKHLFIEMNIGDIALFAVNKTGSFGFIGEIFYKAIYREKLGGYLWDYKPNKPWTHVYFVRNIKEISEIDKRTLLNDLGYRDEKDILQGARSIDSLNFKNLLEKEGYEEIKDYVDALKNA